MSESEEIILKDWLKASILPQIVTQNGLDNEPILEIIVCDSISGGAKYKNDMPKELTLVRKLKDGKEYRMRYKQSKKSFEENVEEV